VRSLPERALVVSPVSSPAVVRHCSRCNADRPFVSSGRFRVNAQKRRLDVWLIRLCADCDCTWNQRLHQRVSPESLGEDLERYHRNDPELAAIAAGDGPSEVAVELAAGEAPCVLRVSLAAPVQVRLDRVLCLALELSRSALARRVELGTIEVDRRALGRRAVDGTEVIVHG
jgi:hypothetical protein